MPTFLIIIIEIAVRLIITLLLVWGAYAAFTAKRSHKFWGTLAAICALATAVNIFIPSSYTPGKRITFTHTYTPKQAKAHNAAVSESKKNAAKESAKKEKAAAIAKKKSKTGLTGLKKQVKAALKENSIQHYQVKVLGIDTAKPYTGNVFLNCTDSSGFKYKYGKSDALLVVKGIKNMNYKDFSKIGIIFTASTIDKYGNKNKETPLLKYQLKKNTLSQINANNIQSLEPVADYYWHSQISEK